jgi:hypothetical protein
VPPQGWGPAPGEPTQRLPEPPGQGWGHQPPTGQQPAWGQSPPPEGPQKPRKPWYRRPWPVVGLVVLAFLVLGLLLPDPEPNPKPTTSPNTTVAQTTEGTEPATTEPQPTEPPTTAAPAAPKAQTISGRGKTATKAFTVDGGMTAMRFQHRGQSNFIVDLLTSRGEEVGNLVNEIGTINGSTGQYLDTGRYLFNIEADGPWSIRIEQPRPASGRGLATTASGRGHSIAGPYQGTGAGVRFELRHRGQANFIVDVLDVDGQELSNLSNEIGSFQGSQIGEVPEGVFWLRVQADGSWTVTMREV